MPRMKSLFGLAKKIGNSISLIQTMAGQFISIIKPLMSDHFTKKLVYCLAEEKKIV